MGLEIIQTELFLEVVSFFFWSVEACTAVWAQPWGGNQLRAIIEAGSLTTTQEVAKKLSVDYHGHSTLGN